MKSENRKFYVSVLVTSVVGAAFLARDRVDRLSAAFGVEMVLAAQIGSIGLALPLWPLPVWVPSGSCGDWIARVYVQLYI